MVEISAWQLVRMPIKKSVKINITESIKTKLREHLEKDPCTTDCLQDSFWLFGQFAVGSEKNLNPVCRNMDLYTIAKYSMARNVNIHESVLLV